VTTTSSSPAAVAPPPSVAAAGGTTSMNLPAGEGSARASEAPAGSPAGVGRGSSIPPVDERPPSRSTPAGPPSLQELLDAIVTTTLRKGGATERARLAALLTEHRLDSEEVVCERCGTAAMPVLSFLFGHFVKAESDYLERVQPADGPNAALHGPGHVRRATGAEILMARHAKAGARR
jgi:hypothetical protein